jgi:DMSO/TMAO reductase YedYZ heme-binding membrane subunit
MLLTTGVVLGILTALRMHNPKWPRFAMSTLHRNVALLALVFGAVHATSSILDSYVKIRLVDAFVPFGSAFSPLWIGIGAISVDLMLAVLITTALRKRLKDKTWRSVHLLSYACWTAAVVHSFALGSDTRTEVWGVLALAACVGAGSGAVYQRLAAARAPVQT